MVRIVKVLELNGRKYVPLEDYQRLIGELEKVQPKYTYTEILKSIGEDEVYNG